MKSWNKMTTTEKINKLIEHYKDSKEEANEFLRELNLVDLTKVSAKEKREITESVIRLSEELHLRKVFIQDLENLI